MAISEKTCTMISFPAASISPGNILHAAEEAVNSVLQSALEHDEVDITGPLEIVGWTEPDEDGAERCIIAVSLPHSPVEIDEEEAKWSLERMANEIKKTT